MNMVHTASPQVLIVEDDPVLNDAYTTILSMADYHVKSVVNGREAIEALQGFTSPPAVILLDLRMPVLDGIGFLEALPRAEYPDTTIVVFSNFDSKDEIDRAYELGADRYILKARATPKELVRLVKSIIK